MYQESQKVHLHISYSLGSIIFLKLHHDLLQYTHYCFIQLKHCTHNSWYFFLSRCWVWQEWVSSNHSHMCNEEYFMVFKSWHIYEWAQKYKRKFREKNKQISLPHIWSQTPSVPFVAVAGLFIISKKNSLIPIGGPKTCTHKCQCKIAHTKRLVSFYDHLHHLRPTQPMSALFLCEKLQQSLRDWWRWQDIICIYFGTIHSTLATTSTHVCQIVKYFWKFHFIKWNSPKDSILTQFFCCSLFRKIFWKFQQYN